MQIDFILSFNSKLKVNMNFTVFALSTLLNSCEVSQKPTVPSNVQPVLSTTERQAENPKPDPQPNFPYDLAYPFAYFDLDESLKEISGLTTQTQDPSVLATLHDEEGKIYMLDKKTGKITSSVFFVTEGDFEGIEMVKDTIFALKSNGQLFKIWNLKGASRSVKMVRTGLPRTANCEGLAYDAANNRLLIASKGQKEGEFVKYIYAYNIGNGTTDQAPVYSITPAQFKEFLADKKDKQYEKLREDYITKNSIKGFEFAPSSVAIHPVSGNVYVTSAVNNILVVLSPEGNVLDLVKLKKDMHFQPEGICFDAEGTMYISNESKDGKPARLVAYKMQKTSVTASSKR